MMGLLYTAVLCLLASGATADEPQGKDEQPRSAGDQPREQPLAALTLEQLQEWVAGSNLPDDAIAAINEKLAAEKVDGAAFLAMDAIELGTLLEGTAAEKVPDAVGALLRYRESFGAAAKTQSKYMESGPILAVRAVVEMCGGWPQAGAGALGTCVIVYLANMFMARQARLTEESWKKKSELKLQQIEEHRAAEVAKMREARLKREAEQAVLKAQHDAEKKEQAAAAAKLKAEKMAEQREAALKRTEQMGKHVHTAIEQAASPGGPASSTRSKSTAAGGKHVKQTGKFPATCVTVHWTGRERRETVDVGPAETVGSLKKKLSQNVIFGLPAVTAQRLVFAGRVLTDDGASLRAAGVSDGAAIHMVVTEIAPAPAPFVASNSGSVGGLPASARLRQRDGSAVQLSELSGKVVALYFSAHWCPPCKAFTPVLKQFYADVQEQHPGAFEIVFVSSDRSAPEMQAYMNESHGNWLALEHTDQATKALLGEKYGVQGIPMLVIIGRNGELVTSQGRNEVSQMGSAAFDRW